jgi:hypothetical protein
MTKTSIRNAETGSELKIVDISERRRASAKRSAATLVVAALVFAAAFAAVAAADPTYQDEPPAADDVVIPWDKPPVPDPAPPTGGVKPTALPT